MRNFYDKIYWSLLQTSLTFPVNFCPMNGEFDDLDLLDSSFKIHSSDGLKSIKLAEFPTSKPGIESPNTFLGPIASLSKINSGMIMPTSTTSNYTPKIHPLKIEINQNVPASDYE